MGWLLVFSHPIGVLEAAAISPKFQLPGISAICRVLIESGGYLSASCVGFVVSVQRLTLGLHRQPHRTCFTKRY